MTTFRDAIVDVIVKVWTEGEDDDDLSLFMAEAVLAMPEMQAIKAFIIRMMESQAVGYWDFGGGTHGENWLKMRLPENVIEWVLS
jgi:hypothetical protein